MMGMKTSIVNNCCLNILLCTVYQTFNDESFKNISSIKLISSVIYKCLKNISSQTYLLQLFYKCLINVFSENVWIENVYKMFFC